MSTTTPNKDTDAQTSGIDHTQPSLFIRTMFHLAYTNTPAASDWILQRRICSKRCLCLGAVVSDYG